MRRFVNFVFLANFLLWGGGFLYSLGLFVAYNGVGNIFEYVKPDSILSNCNIDTVKKVKVIDYTYFVKDIEYHDKISLYIGKVQEYGFYSENITYNSSIPRISCVGSCFIRQRQAKVSMGAYSILFIFILSIYLFADKEKWIGIYTGKGYKKNEKGMNNNGG